jgi:hypothetical protein
MKLRGECITNHRIRVDGSPHEHLTEIGATAERPRYSALTAAVREASPSFASAKSIPVFSFV